MADDFASRFRKVESMPMVSRSNQHGPRASEVTTQISDLVARWDRETTGDDERYMVAECEDESEAAWLYQVCKNATHCRAINLGTEYIYDAHKRGTSVYLVRKMPRPSFDNVITRRRRRQK